MRLPQKLSRIVTRNAIIDGTRGSGAFSSNNVAGTFEVHVHGMSCGGCANKVQQAISAVEGVCEVSVDYKTGMAKYSGVDVNQSEITTAIAEAGYQVHQRYMYNHCVPSISFLSQLWQPSASISSNIP